MSETVERNNRFYTQKNGEIITENEQLKEWLVIANKNNEELSKQRDMYKSSFETMSENYFRLQNIIKEVREILESKKHCERLFGGIEGKTFIEQALEILDKENK